MKNNRLYVDVHILQTVPPSCLNRDDTGSPKTAMYGGVYRARVSSQSWKKAVRDMFREELVSEEKLGVRTKHIVKMVADEIEKLGGENPEKSAQEVLGSAGIGLKENKKSKALEPGALFFLSAAQAKALAALAVNGGVKDKKEAQSALNRFPGVDVALFGRMVADDPALNTDACAQVAHSISTHKVSNEYDYFTAVDDMAPEDNAGAGMIGTVEYNSATLYRYATVAVHELREQLETETTEAVCAFVDAFIRSMPKGKQNTFANWTPPDAVLVTIRTNQPINLVGAFEKPVSASESGYREVSSKVFIDYAKSTYENWLGSPDVSLVTGELFSGLGEPKSLAVLLAALADEIQNRLRAGE